MKKNRTMRIAAVMLVLALLTTCIISGSFAKYVTEGTAASDTARVAKWGVEFSGTGTLFAEEYPSDTPGVAGVTVKSSTTGEKVVAPGTSGTLATFSMAGTPEVSFKLSFEATVSKTGAWVSDANNTEYMPLTFTVNGTECTFANLKNTIEAVEASYNAGGDAIDQTISITWAWAINESDDPDDATNVKDTYLGNWAKRGETKPEITIAVTAKATQID